MKFKILIIGLGNIGIRHLESIKKSDKYQIFLVDKDIKNKVRKINILKKTNNFESINQLKLKKIDLIIIATDSKPRINLLKTCLQKFSVKYVILEKIVLKNSNDLSFLNRCKNTKIFFNYPRQAFPFYKYLKRLAGKEITQMHIEGDRWGMGSNFMHFVYLFTFLTNSKDLIVREAKLHKKLYNSKRLGYNEIKGKIQYENSFGQKLFISDKKNQKFLIKVISKENEYYIDEIKDELIIKNIKKFKIDTIQRKITIFQSKLTSKIIDDIFNERDTIPLSNNSLWIENVYLVTKNLIDNCYLEKVYLS